jgi:hypothetical protein
VRQEGEFFRVRLYEPKVRQSDVFCLVYQTQWQEEVMKSRFRQNLIIPMDTTHNITKHRSIFLTTLMVVRPSAEWEHTGVRYIGILLKIFYFFVYCAVLILMDHPGHWNSL